MKERFPVLDGLRGLAILMVALLHTMVALNWKGSYLVQITAGFGGRGVDLFFVLSGFLLFYPYAQAILTQSPWPSWQTFYIRRMRRILPAFYATTALLAVLILVAGLPLSLLL